MTTDFLLGGDLRINRLGFGAMRLPAGTFDGPVRDPETGRAVLRRALELGVDHIDTAGFYQRGGVASHELIREALAPYPANLVIASKVGPLPGDDGLPSREATAGELRGLVEADLRRLGLDRLDLVYLRVGGMHPPADDPVGERFAALAALRDEGLIRHLGVSNVSAAQFAEAQAIAPVAAVQNHFRVGNQADAGIRAQCAAQGIAYVPFFPIGGGFTETPPQLAKVAERHGASPAQISLAWLLALSPVMLAIPGTGSLAHLAENMAAAGIRLSAEDLRLLAPAPAG
jgi:pyridoxine 4-dehydrogenase